LLMPWNKERTDVLGAIIFTLVCLKKPLKGGIGG